MHLSVQQASQIFKLLGDTTRCTMLRLFMDKAYCVCELVELFDMSQPAISQHLRKLKDIALVQEERKGQWIYYSLHPDYPGLAIVKQWLSTVDLPQSFHQAAAKQNNLCQ